MATANKQAQTKVVDTLVIGGSGAKGVKKSDDIVKALGGRQLGSPINGIPVGKEFDVVLTGKIEIRDFNGQKGAYYLTKQGISVRVNASFDPAVHKENAEMKCICLQLDKDPENGILRDVKYAAFVTVS